MSLRLGKVAGIPIVLTENWLWFIVLMSLFNVFSGGLMYGINTALVIGFLAVFIILHELGHSLTALKFGARTSVISLTFLGGAAQISEAGWYKLIAQPAKALLVWAAGPAVSVGLYFLLKALAGVMPSAYLSTGTMYLAYTNLALAIFNLMPVYPLDGGGILYCLMRFIFSKTTAIKITSVVGVIGSIAFILAAIYFKAIMLGIIGVLALVASYRAPKSILFA